jgi:hypothetical protein
LPTDRPPTTILRQDRSQSITIQSERNRRMARRDTKGSWTRDDVKQLKKLFPDRPTADVAAELGRPTEAVKKKASRMGLRKSRRYMKSLGRT